jgi:hypothetical protein
VVSAVPGSQQQILKQHGGLFTDERLLFVSKKEEQKMFTLSQTSIPNL